MNSQTLLFEPSLSGLPVAQSDGDPAHNHTGAARLRLNVQERIRRMEYRHDRFKVCKNCGKQYLTSRQWCGKFANRYCSNECVQSGEGKPCEWCGKSTLKGRYNKNNSCSESCAQHLRAYGSRESYDEQVAIAVSEFENRTPLKKIKKILKRPSLAQKICRDAYDNIPPLVSDIANDYAAGESLNHLSVKYGSYGAVCGSLALAGIKFRNGDGKKPKSVRRNLYAEAIRAYRRCGCSQSMAASELGISCSMIMTRCRASSRFNSRYKKKTPSGKWSAKLERTNRKTSLFRDEYAFVESCSMALSSAGIAHELEYSPDGYQRACDILVGEYVVECKTDNLLKRIDQAIGQSITRSVLYSKKPAVCLPSDVPITQETSRVLFALGILHCTEKTIADMVSCISASRSCILI